MNKIFIITFFAVFFTTNVFSQCNAMMERYDEFENEQTYMSSIYNNVKLYRIIKANKSTYYLSLSARGYTASVDGTGVICILSDNTKFQKPAAKIDVNVDDSNYRYSAMFPVTVAEINRLIKSPIKKFKLYIYTHELSETQQLEDAETMQCIMTKK